MSSRLMPPKVGSSEAMMSISLSGSRSASSMSNTSTPANFLNRQALAFHHRLGSQRADIAQAQHGGAVGDHAHQIAARGVLDAALQGSASHIQAGVSHAGGVGQRQVTLVGQGLGRGNRQSCRAWETRGIPAADWRSSARLSGKVGVVFSGISSRSPGRKSGDCTNPSLRCNLWNLSSHCRWLLSKTGGADQVLPRVTTPSTQSTSIVVHEIQQTEQLASACAA